MTTATLKLETLHLIPHLAEDFDQQVESMVNDCRKRPSLTKPRKVTVEIVITPHPDDPEDVWIEPVTKTKAPARAIDPIRARQTKRGQLQFDFSNDGGTEDDAQ